MPFKVNPILSPSQKTSLTKLLDLRRDPGRGMSLEELEGFLFGLAIHPSLIMPSKWVPEITGGEGFEFDSEKQAGKMMGDLMAAYNSFVGVANRGIIPFPYDVKPLEGNFPDGLLDWCRGLERGIYLDKAGWRIASLPMPESGGNFMESPAFALFLVQAVNDDKLRKGFFTVDGRKIKDDRESLELAVSLLPSALEDLQEYSTILRNIERAKMRASLERRPEPKKAELHRNDPCPCGSGKKYKKCCGTGN